MSPRSNIFLWLLATMLTAGLTAWAVTQRNPPAAKNFPPEASNPAVAGLSLHDWMHRHLHLTPAQHGLLDPLESAFGQERVALRQQIRQLSADLARVIREDSPADEVFSVQEQLHETQGRLQQATLRHFLEMKNHLTPAQAEKLRDWTHDSLLLGSSP